MRAVVEPILRVVDRMLSAATAVPSKINRDNPSKTGDLVYNALLLVITAGLVVTAIRFVLSGVGISEVGRAALLGLATAGRVLVLLLFSTLVWTPIGVTIGFNPRLGASLNPLFRFSRRSQPTSFSRSRRSVSSSSA
jgi:NitT/TauT family transport system permease protein